jgi:hypothetical protein
MATHSSPKAPGTPAWVDLVTPESAASRAFYAALFGWEYDVGGPEFGGYTTARIGERSTAGIVGESPDAPPSPPAWCVYFATNDIDADVTRAESLGAKLLYPAMAVGEFGAMATLEDPTGTQFSFWQAGQHIGFQMVNEPGSTAWFELASTDAKAARDFYAALLGATSEAMPGGLEYYTLSNAVGPLVGVMQIDPAWGGLPAQWFTYFGVADASEAVARAEANGGKALSGIDESPFGRLATLADPHGAQFKIVEV